MIYKCNLLDNCFEPDYLTQSMYYENNITGYYCNSPIGNSNICIQNDEVIYYNINNSEIRVVGEKFYCTHVYSVAKEQNIMIYDKMVYYYHFIPLKINKDIILTKELIAKIKTRIIFS